MKDYLAVIEVMCSTIEEHDRVLSEVIRCYSDEDGFEVAEHLPHECEPERVCFKFQYDNKDANDALIKYLVIFGGIGCKSVFYTYDPSDGYLRYETFNKKGELDKVWLRPDRNDKSAQYYRRKVKNVMSVYYKIEEEK